jgi:hypothetical protein
MMTPGSMMTTAMKICFNSMLDHRSTHTKHASDRPIRTFPPMGSLHCVDCGEPVESGVASVAVVEAREMLGLPSSFCLPSSSSASLAFFSSPASPPRARKLAPKHAPRKAALRRRARRLRRQGETLPSPPRDESTAGTSAMPRPWPSPNGRRPSTGTGDRSARACSAACPRPSPLRPRTARRLVCERSIAGVSGECCVHPKRAVPWDCQGASRLHTLSCFAQRENLRPEPHKHAHDKACGASPPVPRHLQPVPAAWAAVRGERRGDRALRLYAAVAHRLGPQLRAAAPLSRTQQPPLSHRTPPHSRPASARDGRGIRAAPRAAATRPRCTLPASIRKPDSIGIQYYPELHTNSHTNTLIPVNPRIRGGWLHKCTCKTGTRIPIFKLAR